MSTPTTVRPFEEADWSDLWPLLQATFARGDTYAYPPDSPQADIHRAWIETPTATYVACAADGRIVGTYVLKPNQPGLGGHVCNAGYVVAPEAQGQGIASLMCLHSQAEALRLGFLAMQFNLVVATNTRAIALWTRLGFATVGTLQSAFRHAQLGLVDALVMYKELRA